MRYQGALLSALASIALASDDATAENPLAVPDALPLDDLREIPVPTYSIATGTSQDVPYATSAAIAEVAAQVAATPLSVFPAATDVPINAAGTTDSNESYGDGGNPNVIGKSESISKREVSGVARQPRKRGACSPQPTIANFYNVDVSSAAGFKADASIASIASGASTPAGYFQNFKNLGAANSAMNYLGYTVVNTVKGYDVDYCAAKCNAKAGCLSFNIYFERDPPSNQVLIARTPKLLQTSSVRSGALALMLLRPTTRASGATSLRLSSLAAPLTDGTSIEDRLMAGMDHRSRTMRL